MADCYINSGACDNDFRELYDNITLLTLDEYIIGLIICEKNEIQGFLRQSVVDGDGGNRIVYNKSI